MAHQSIRQTVIQSTRQTLKDSVQHLCEFSDNDWCFSIPSHLRAQQMKMNTRHDAVRSHTSDHCTINLQSQKVMASRRIRTFIEATQHLAYHVHTCADFCRAIKITCLRYHSSCNQCNCCQHSQTLNAIAATHR